MSANRRSEYRQQAEPDALVETVRTVDAMDQKSPLPGAEYGLRHVYPRYPPSRPPHHLHSVVTSSFSLDDEREDQPIRGRHISSGHYLAPPRMEERYHHPHAPLCRDMDHEARAPPPPPDPVTIPPSPSGEPPAAYIIKRSHSTGSAPYRVPHESLKRSFWHHARPSGDYGQSHPDFTPPKRAKITTKKKEVILTARSPTDKAHLSERVVGDPYGPGGWFSRTMSWDAREAEMVYCHQPPSGHSFSPPWSRGHHPAPSPRGSRDGEIMAGWPDAGRSCRAHPPSPQEHPQYSPTNAKRGFVPPTVEVWSPSNSSTWNSRAPAASPPWGRPPMSAQHRDELETSRNWVAASHQDREGDAEVRRQVTFESGPEVDPYRRHPFYNPQMSTIGTNVMEAPASRFENKVKGRDNLAPRTLYCSTTGEDEAQSPPTDTSKLRLLALPEDKISLSETLCVVRENIEVFTATRNDVEAPAPGRKHAVVVGQVGLRCIHCRHTTRSSDRVKRAVCYPSSIKRIYRTAIDMKLDHFLHCKFVPMALKNRLHELKAINTRSTGTTMQYFIRAAQSLGMVDGPSGVRLVEKPQQGVADSGEAPTGSSGDGKQPSKPATSDRDAEEAPSPKASAPKTDGEGDSYNSDESLDSSSKESESLVAGPTKPGGNETYFVGRIKLGLPEDKMSLSPLRCFLRDQVCAFSATKEDIAVRTPTTFSVSVGQVGIGCSHCLNQPAKLRSNRAVCFPFSIARIYQSVADIQRFHLGECKMVPQEIKEKFQSLSSASSKGSKGLATRQYWITSAKKIGLVDTPGGIRFCRDPSAPEAPAISLDILAHVASNVTTASKPLVLPEDKPHIAEFLYVVMEQLQPCRFTEADRNKRRLKDVGCIGVECKHCARQVDSRKFFWSSVNAVESNFVSVHTHMMECRMVPDELKAKLAKLKLLRKEQTAALKTGSQKAFFCRVWSRLHESDGGTAQVDAGAQPQQNATASSKDPPSSPSTSSLGGVSDGLEKMAMTSV